MTKASWLLVLVAALPGGICVAQSDACAGMEGSAMSQCRSEQTLRLQRQLEQQLQEQQERQNQLDRQQREVQRQLEGLRLQNESLRQQLERETVAPAAKPVATDSARVPSSADVRSWHADNPWFGSDYAKTQFAMRYITQLQQQRPDLAGRDLLDALTAKVNETFAVGR
jgi:hypothetical protein